MRQFLYGSFLVFIFYANATGQANLSIVLGNDVVLAYDQTERKHNFNTEIDAKIDNGQHQLYKNHYRSSLDYYTNALEAIIELEKGKEDKALFDTFERAQKKDKRLTKTEKLLREIEKLSLEKGRWIQVANICHDLGIYYHHLGDYRVAEIFTIKALQLKGREAGNTSETYIATLHNLAVLRKDQGRFDASEDMFGYLMNYYGQSPDSYKYAIVSNNHAMLLASMGRLDEASNMLNGIDTSSDSFPAHSLDGARVKVNLALLHIENQKYGSAETELNEAVAIYLQKEGKKLFDYNKIQIYLASVLLRSGQTTNLEELIDTNLAELSKEFGEGSISYLDAAELKGDYLMSTGRYNEAAIIYDQISQGRKALLGVLHTDYLLVQGKLADCYWRSNRIDEAYRLFSSNRNRYLRVIDEYFYFLSDNEKAKFWELLKPELDLYFSFAIENYAAYPSILEDVFTLRMRTKGLLLQSSNRSNRALQASQNDLLMQKYEDWKELKRVLSSYYSQEQEVLEELSESLDLMEKEANTLEKEINQSVSNNQQLKRPEIFLSDIQTRLNDNEALVEIIRINEASNSPRENQYVALILSNTQIELVKIGNAKELEGKVAKYYHNTIRMKIEETVASEKLWQPIASQLVGKEKIFISLDGIYNTININSLRSNNEFIIEGLNINIIPNPGVLLKNNSEQINAQIVLVGNPNFSDGIDQLPGTAIEVAAIKNVFERESVELFVQGAATETALKKIQKPKVLHIATHGFFDADKQIVSASRQSVVRTNPLLKSGLLMSKPSNVPKSRIKDDGIFTSYDAMNLNLQYTDLVVLSACETGKGEVVNGEGVYGLSRAFTIAGARHLIISLWKVNDQATNELMTNFYSVWKETGDISTSFRTAQLAIKTKYKDPYYWAAFVLVNNE